MDFGIDDDQALQAVIGGLDHDQMDFKKLEELLSMQSNEFDSANPDTLFGGFPDQTDVHAPQAVAQPEDLNSLNEAKDLVAYVSGNNGVGVLSPPQSDEDPYSPNSQRPDPHLLAVLQHRYPTVPIDQLVRQLQSSAMLPQVHQQRLGSFPTPPRPVETASPANLSPAGGLITSSTKSPPPPHANPMPKKRKYEDHSTLDAPQLNHFEFESAPLAPPPPVSDLSYQSLKWQSHCPRDWAPLLDSQLTPIVLRDFQVEADKGFNFSTVDDAFVCQKKNHFQVTCLVSLPRPPQYIQTPAGPKPIESLRLYIHGMKLESQSSSIKVEQSQPDRTKRRYEPSVIPFEDVGKCGKSTVGRLHFSETTANNMRKKGKPNPDQRYFSLVVSIHAHSSNGQHCMIAAQNSERIIVRASNPGQFESDAEVAFKPGQNPDSLYYMGRVGVNTDRPDEALVVHGNVRVTGKVRAPSDERAKEVLGLVDSKQQLKNVSELPIYQYRFKEEVAEYLGLPESDRDQVGVLAQELRGVLPDAVKETDDIDLPSGEKIEKFLVVDKDRLYMENVGAVKELCKLTDALEDRIGHLEKIQKKLKRNSSRTGSLALSTSGKSTSKRVESESSSEVSSLSTTPSSTMSRKTGSKIARDLEKARTDKKALFKQHPLCTARFMQGLILLLIVIMATSAIAMAVLFALSSSGTSDSGTSNVMTSNGTQDMNHTNSTVSPSSTPSNLSPTTLTVSPRLSTSRIKSTSSTMEPTTRSIASGTSSSCCATSLQPLTDGEDPESRGGDHGQPVVDGASLREVRFDKPGSRVFNRTTYDLQCNSCKGNVTYSFSLPAESSIPGLVNVTLSFGQAVNLYLCNGWGHASCTKEGSSATKLMGLPRHYSPDQDNSKFDLQLPILRDSRMYSNYTFRAVKLSNSSGANCSSSLADAGKTFTVYVLEFVRVCGISEVEWYVSS